MDIYAAVNYARDLSNRSSPFRLVFQSYDESTGEVGGEKVVRQCLLRKSNPEDKNRNYKLFYYDVEKELNRSCWIPLVISINGNTIETP